MSGRKTARTMKVKGGYRHEQPNNRDCKNRDDDDDHDGNENENENGIS